MKVSTATATLRGVFGFCAGTLLVILPWSAVWEHNHFLDLWPSIEPILASTATRTAVTALGLANLLLGVAEVRSLTRGTGPDDPPT